MTGKQQSLRIKCFYILSPHILQSIQLAEVEKEIANFGERFHIVDIKNHISSESLHCVVTYKEWEKGVK